MKSDSKHLIHYFFKQIKIVLVLFYPFFSFSQDSVSSKKNSVLQLHGYVKKMETASFIDNSSSLITGNLIHNRLNFKWNISSNFYTRIECRNRMYFGEQVKTTNQFGKFIDIDNGLVDLSYNIIDDTSLVLNTTLDRFLINWSTNKWDVTIGRQRINWGVNLVWNPNDIFNAFNYFDFDYEERPGSDAIRIQRNVGNQSSLEVAYKLSDKKNEHVGALMYKTNFKKYDWQSFAGIYFKDIVLGTGWAGNIKNFGFKGEASYFHSYNNLLDTNGILSASVSFDRSFKNNYFSTISYLYNSNGKDNPNEITDLARTTLSSKKLMPFTHSFFGQLSKSFNPLVSANIAFIFSPKNNTLILLPSIAVSVSDNWDISLVGQSFFYDINGVYRTLGNGIYFRLRWSY